MPGAGQIGQQQYQQADSAGGTGFCGSASGRYRIFQLSAIFVPSNSWSRCNCKAKAAGMLLGLYRDLAVGVSEASTEIWANTELYCRDASVGAPPDILGPKGQNWGLPPMLPYQLFRQAYRPMIELFRANMQDSGALRIDHVMALLETLVGT